MQTKEILYLSCDFLGLSELKNVIETDEGDESQQAKASLLLKCLNLVHEEILTEYMPIFVTEKVKITDGEVAFSALSQKVSGIAKVTDVRGRGKAYSLSADHICVKGSEAVITYQIMPEQLTKQSEISTSIPPRVYAYGVAREWLFVQGQSDEALNYERRFKDSLCSFARKRSLHLMPKREWK